MVVLDEAAFLGNEADQIFTAVQPTMATLGDKGRMILISTPNGLGNLFANLWYTAEDWKQIQDPLEGHTAVCQRSRVGRETKAPIQIIRPRISSGI